MILLKFNKAGYIILALSKLPFFVVFPMLDPEVPPSPILLLVPCSHSHLRELQIDWDWPPSSFFEKCTVRGVFFRETEFITFEQYVEQTADQIRDFLVLYLKNTI